MKKQQSLGQRWFEQSPMFAAYLFNFLSYIATFAGMHALMSSVGSGGLMALVFAGLFTLGLQMMLLYAVVSFKGVGTLRSKVRWFSIYLICVFFSIGFGYAFWFQHIRADHYAEELYTRQINASQAKLIAFEQSYGQLAATLESLADYSNKTAQKEREAGGTCGSHSPVGPGPRMLQREEDARTFKSFVEYFADQKKTIQEMLETVKDKTATFAIDRLDKVERVLNEAVYQANAMKGDTQLVELKATLTTRLEQGRAGFIRSGVAFTCPDRVLEAKGRAILGVELPDLEEVAFMDPTDSKAILYLAFGRLMELPALAMDAFIDAAPQSMEEMTAERINLLQNGQAEPSDTTDTGFDQADTLPLLLGCMVDLLILISARPKARSRLSDSPLGNLEEAVDDDSPGVNPATWDTLRRYVEGEGTLFLQALLQRYEMPFNKQRYVVVPFPAYQEEQVQLSRLLELLIQLKGADLVTRRYKVTSLPGWWVDNHASELAGVNYVELYELDNKFRNGLLIEILRACRQTETKSRRTHTTTSTAEQEYQESVHESPGVRPTPPPREGFDSAEATDIKAALLPRVGAISAARTNARKLN